MKKFNILILLLIFSCQNKTTDMTISSMEAFGMLKNDFAIMFDVRDKTVITETAEFAVIESIENLLNNSSVKNNPRKIIILITDSSLDLSNSLPQLTNQNYKIRILNNFQEWKELNLPTKQIN